MPFASSGVYEKGFSAAPFHSNADALFCCIVGDLPRSLQQAASHVLGLTGRPISIFVIPATTRLKNRYGWERDPEQALLFTDEGVAHLQAISAEDARPVYLKAANLRSTCLSLILMNGRLELVDDCLTRVVVEFNALL